MFRHRDRGRMLSIALVAATVPCAVGASPRITEVLGPAPVHGQRGATIGFLAQGLTSPVRVFFSDGSNPNVEASPVDVDLGRGIVFARVPAGAVTGTMKLTAGGIDSNPYRFRVDAGTFDQGSSTVSGQVTNGAIPVAGAAVVLLAFDTCDNDTLWDRSITDATGHYALTGKNGMHFLFVFPPVASGLASSGAPLLLAPIPAVVNVSLDAGVVVSGRVVRAASPGTGVGDTRVEFDSDSGFDTRLTDATGYFAVRVSPGDTRARVSPPAGQVLSSTRQSLSIAPGGPVVLPDFALQGGVRISGLVRSANGLTPMPNAEINAQDSNRCCDDADRTLSGGDGSFTLVVAPGQTYRIVAQVDDREAYADAQLSDVVVANADVVRDMNLADAGAITGVVVDAQSGDPIGELSVQAALYPSTGATAAFTRTCGDGTYRLRVPPAATGYLVSAGFGEDHGYVPTTWDGSAAGTFFSCEGGAVPVSSAGVETGNVDFQVPTGTASVSGGFRTQDSGCTLDAPGDFWVAVDDGTSHSCTLGTNDWNAAPGTYRVFGLPSSEMLSTLRVCVASSPTTSAQCWDGRKSGGAYDAVDVGSGETASSIDFCVGNVPVQQTQGLRASKTPGGVTFSWSATTDLYQTRYRLRGASVVRPFTPQGSFPSDPGFTAVYDGQTASAFVPLSQIYIYYLVTNVGQTGVEGPSGSYAP